MTTSLADDAKAAEWAPLPSATAGRGWNSAEWLWTLFGVALLVAFLIFLVDDYPLRNLIAIR